MNEAGTANREAMAADEVPSRDDMLARAEALIPVVAERAAAAEASGRIPDVTIDDLHTAGLWRVNQPRWAGGGEHDIRLLIESAGTLSRGCGSTGWVYINLAVHHWMLAMWPAQAQDEIWGADPDALIASSVIFPAGKTAPADGGYRLSGRWPFCSGVTHSRWVMLGGTIARDGAPPEPRTFIVPVDQCTQIDTWDAAGLSATGSLDVACEDVFVPEHMTLRAADTRGGPTPGSARNPQPLYRQSVGGLFPHMVATNLHGMARGMYDLCVERFAARESTQAKTRIAGLVTVHHHLAEAGVKLDAGRFLIRNSFDESLAYAEAGEVPPAEATLRWRRDGAYVATLASEAAALLHRTTGASAVYKSNAMQRQLRDLQTGLTHAHISFDINGTAYGRAILGVDD